MDDGNLAVLVDAKTEYTKQLVNILKPNIYAIFLEIFETCQRECAEQNMKNKVFLEFQRKMRDVPNWNNEIIKNHCETIMKNSNCDWIEELITAVFVSHTRILTSINLNKSKGKIDLNIPKSHNFIHKCFIDIARYFWKNSYLFEEKQSKFEYQKNRRETELLIDASINETIRKELPVKNILKKYLGTEYEDEDPDNFEEAPNNNLKKMVLKELENCSNEKLNKLKLILAEEPKPVSLEESKPVSLEEPKPVSFEETTSFSPEEPKPISLDMSNPISLDTVPNIDLDLKEFDLDLDIKKLELPNKNKIDVKLETDDNVSINLDTKQIEIPVKEMSINLNDTPKPIDLLKDNTEASQKKPNRNYNFFDQI